jgi:hypothetical protein
MDHDIMVHLGESAKLSIGGMAHREMGIILVT